MSAALCSAVDRTNERMKSIFVTLGGFIALQVHCIYMLATEAKS